MIAFPVSIKARPYQGSKQNLQRKYYERIALAKKVEAYINERVALRGADKILYVEIAQEFCTTKVKLRDDLVFPVGAGDNGLSVAGREGIDGDAEAAPPNP